MSVIQYALRKMPTMETNNIAIPNKIAVSKNGFRIRCVVALLATPWLADGNNGVDDMALDCMLNE